MKIENLLVVVGLIQVSTMSLWYWSSDLEGITKWIFSADANIFFSNIVSTISITADRSFFSSQKKEKVTKTPLLTLD